MDKTKVDGALSFKTKFSQVFRAKRDEAKNCLLEAGFPLPAI
jgi:hypothetical protein